MSSSDQGDLRTPESGAELTEQAHTDAQRALCGARAPHMTFVWLCNKKAGHKGRHAYRTPNGESQVHWAS